jgi:hypothetical protein
MSTASVRLYLDLCDEYGDSPLLAQRLEDIGAVGQAFYIAQDEKKRSNCMSGSTSAWSSK